jgi:hypothetical protein
MTIKRVNKNVVFENRWLRLYDDAIEHPDGSAGTYSWVERNNGRGGHGAAAARRSRAADQDSPLCARLLVVGVSRRGE